MRALLGRNVVCGRRHTFNVGCASDERKVQSVPQSTEG
jgi:hypothetical protein